MSLNLSCLNINENISLIENKPIEYNHLIYKSNDKNILKYISSLIINCLFSLNDFELYIKNSFKYSSKFVSLIIIYLSLILLLILTCSIIFYIISYSNIKQINQIYLKYFYFILFIFIYFYLFIEIIFIIKKLNKTKLNINKCFYLLNNEINSNNLSKHLKYLLNKLNKIRINSLIINQSKHFMINRYSNLLNNYYFLNEINLFLKNLNELIDNKIIEKFFIELKIFYENIFIDLSYLNNKICFYFQNNYLNIEQKILFLLNIINQYFENFIYLIDKEFLNKFYFKLNEKNKINSFILLIINLTIINIILIIIIPLIFLILIIINYFYFYFNYQNNM